MQSVAKIFSVVFHPIFMVFYAYLVVFLEGSYHAYLPFQIKRFVLLIVFINTVLIPLILLLFAKYAGIIKQLELNDRRDRLIAVALLVIMYLFTFFMFRRLGLPYILLKIIVGGIVAMIVAATVTCWWKISLHSIGVGGFIGFLFVSVVSELIPLNGLPLIAVLIAGILMSSRLELGSHSPKQVYVGFIAGLFSLLILFSL